MFDKDEEGVNVTDSINVMYCTVVTPEAIALEMACKFVALPLIDGEIGIAPGHTPLIGRLGYGELRVVDGDRVVRYYLDGGFVQVTKREISILTNKAVPAEAIDPVIAEEQLRSSLSRVANTPELMAQRDKIQQQAWGQLRIARRAR